MAKAKPNDMWNDVAVARYIREFETNAHQTFQDMYLTKFPTVAEDLQIQEVRTLDGQTITYSAPPTRTHVCPVCAGTGKKRNEECWHCGGEGLDPNPG